MDAHTPVLTHRKSCSITCSSGPKLRLVKLNWHRMTNKIVQTFIRSIGKSYCTAADQSMSFNLTHIGLIDNQSTAHLDVCEVGISLQFHQLLQLLQWWMARGRQLEREQWIKLEREDAGGRVFRNRMKSFMWKKENGMDYQGLREKMMQGKGKEDGDRFVFLKWLLDIKIGKTNRYYNCI